MDKQIIVYKAPDGNELAVKTDGETVWLTQDQMCLLFGRTQPVIARHIANVFKEGELPKEGFMQILHKTSTTGGRPVAIYNLDVVISVGYRVKSFQGTRFRRWATGILREMLLNRLEEVREIAKLKHRVDVVEGDIKQIKGGMNFLVKQLSEPAEPPRRRIGLRRRQRTADQAVWKVEGLMILLGLGSRVEHVERVEVFDRINKINRIESVAVGAVPII